MHKCTSNQNTILHVHVGYKSRNSDLFFSNTVGDTAELLSLLRLKMRLISCQCQTASTRIHMYYMATFLSHNESYVYRYLNDLTFTIAHEKLSITIVLRYIKSRENSNFIKSITLFSLHGMPKSQ